MEERDAELEKLKTSRRPIIWTALDIIESREITKESHDSVVPQESDLLESPNVSWIVNLKENRSLLEDRYFHRSFKNEAEAAEFFNKFKNGKELRDIVTDGPLSERQILDIQLLLDQGLSSESLSFGTNIDGTLAYLVLNLVGIVEFNDEISSNVLDYIGNLRLTALKRSFPVNWSYVAQMEYAMRKFPKDSPAYVAAALRYYGIVTNELQIAGYLLRDLEVLCRDLEIVYLAKFEGDQRRKIGSKETGTRSLEGRYVTLIEQMERVLANPTKFKLERPTSGLKLAQNAAEYLQSKKNKYWKVGGLGSVETYLNTIKCDPGREKLTSKLSQIEVGIKNYNYLVLNPRND